MPCFYPVHGWRSASGKLTQDPGKAVSPIPKTVPCLGCIGCRVTKTSEWACRSVLELRSWADSCFITLTYSPENLPPNSTLNPKHLADFWKRLRQQLARDARKAGLSPPMVRYFSCGEYGEKFVRPHYHAILFGWSPSDGVKIKETDFGPLSSSAFLSDVWGLGYVSFGDVRYESCAYVASYVQAKLTGKDAEEAYIDRFAPFARMSTRPGLGLEAVYSLDSEFERDDIWLGGSRSSPLPRYFMETLKASNPPLYERLVKRRKDKANKPDSILEQRPERLLVREQVLKAKLASSHGVNYHADFLAQ